MCEEFKSERDAAKRSAMRAFEERDILLAQLKAKEAPMDEGYIRCRKGHIDTWFSAVNGPECPLCEVRARGWANPSKPDPLDRWERGK